MHRQISYFYRNLKSSEATAPYRYAQHMTSEQLSDIDKRDLQDGLKVSVIFGLFIVLALAVILAIILGVATLLFGQPTDGIGHRIMPVLLLSLIAFSHPFLIAIDMALGKKNIFKTSDYNIIQNKKKHFIKINDNRKTPKIELEEELIAKIDTSKPLTIERTKASKTLLFVSHDKENILKN
jgi:hypothetical protein